MDVYSLIFYAPAVQTIAAATALAGLTKTGLLTNSSGSPSAMALQLCSLMWDLLHQRSVSKNMDSLHAVTPHALLYNFMPSDQGKKEMLLRRLWLAAALVPWRHLTYDTKERKVPILENVMREGLKVSFLHFLFFSCEEFKSVCQLAYGRRRAMCFFPLRCCEYHLHAQLG